MAKSINSIKLQEIVVDPTAGAVFQLVEKSKVCPCCQKEKKASQYYQTRAKYGGLETYCKDCAKKKKRAIYRAKKAKIGREKQRTNQFNPTLTGELSEIATNEFSEKLGEAIQGLIDAKKI